MSRPTAYWCERAWLGPGPGSHDGVLVRVADGRVAELTTGVAAPPADADALRGLVLPGLADAHSHAFHRALRGRTHRPGAAGSFWGWREQMYAVAATLDPDSYHRLARAAYAELALAGYTAVGEFHYVHHGPDGVPYAEPNEMGHALVAAAREAGLAITLLDTCYLTAGPGEPLRGVQLRFGDRDATGWAERVDALAADYADADDVVVGAAVHSVRAVPPDQMPTVAGWAAHHAAPLHVHLSEQVAENEACQAAYGRTPTALLHESGVLGPRTTAVHGTHLTDGDIALLGDTGTTVCLCPTTERELADGIGPGRALADAGVALAVGSDSQAVVDPFEELRAVEMHERLASGERGRFGADELLAAGTLAGHTCLGRPDGGQLAVGARADLVAVDLTGSVRTAGAAPPQDAVVFAAAAADVTDVVVGGRRVVASGEHRLGAVAPALAGSIDALQGDQP